MSARTVILINITFSLIVLHNSASVHFSQQMYSLGIEITRGVHKITIEFDLISIIIKLLYEFSNHNLIIFNFKNTIFINIFNNISIHFCFFNKIFNIDLWTETKT